MSPSHDITRILNEHSRGDASAAQRLMPLVYEKLHDLAGNHMQRERPDHTLQATALVHEAYLRLVDQSRVDWRGRTHFFAIAAGMMPRILVDHARRKRAVKRGAGLHRIQLEGIVSPGGGLEEIDVIAIGEALEKLRKLSKRQARVVELRFFGGLGIEETARELRVSPDTVKRDWRFARAWLRSRLMAEREP